VELARGEEGTVGEKDIDGMVVVGFLV